MCRSRTCCCSSTTSSASPRRVLRSPRCSAGCRRPWATSRRWPTRWASCRSGSPRPAATPSPRCRRSTCPPTTSPTRRRTPRSPTWTRPPCSAAADHGEGHLPGRGPARLHARASSTQRTLVEEHYGVAREVQRDPAALQGAAGHHRHPRHRRAVGRGQGHGAARAANRALPVPADVRGRSSSPASPGAFVPLEETVASFKAITEGKYDHVPEQAFFLCGGIEDIERKAKDLERS